MQSWGQAAQNLTSFALLVSQLAATAGASITQIWHVMGPLLCLKVQALQRLATLSCNTGRSTSWVVRCKAGCSMMLHSRQSGQTW